MTDPILDPIVERVATLTDTDALIYRGVSIAHTRPYVAHIPEMRDRIRWMEATGARVKETLNAGGVNFYAGFIKINNINKRYLDVTYDTHTDVNLRLAWYDAITAAEDYYLAQLAGHLINNDDHKWLTGVWEAYTPYRPNKKETVNAKKETTDTGITLTLHPDGTVTWNAPTY